MKIVMAPINVAGQPMLLADELQRRSVDVALWQYDRSGDSHRFDYRQHRIVGFDARDPMQVEVETVKETVDESVDLYHFWLSTFFANPGNGRMRGLDLLFLKARGKHVIYQGMGFDLRRRSIQEERNPYNPYRYGYKPFVEDEQQRRYLEFIGDYADHFVVQDPEMLEHIPGARVIPKGIDLRAWPHVGSRASRRPLVVHVPSKDVSKGTEFVVRAVEDLQREGVAFDFKLIRGMPHQEAVRWYAKADIVVDQLLIGWYGTVTLEALALGKPVIVYVRDDLLDRFTPQIPVEPANPENVKLKLRELLYDQARREALSLAARPFVEQVHDIGTVATSMHATYEEVLAGPVREPQTGADFDWFLTQFAVTAASQQRAKELDVMVRRQNKLRAAAGAGREKDRRRFAATEQRYRARLREATASLGEGEEEIAAFLGLTEEEQVAELDRLVEERRTLRRRVNQRIALEDEVARLRAAVGSLEPLVEERRALRGRLKRLADVQAEVTRLKAETARSEGLLRERRNLRVRLNRSAAVAREVAQLKEQTGDYEAVLSELKTLRARARRRDRVLAELGRLPSESAEAGELGAGDFDN